MNRLISYARSHTDSDEEALQLMAKTNIVQAAVIELLLQGYCAGAVWSPHMEKTIKPTEQEPENPTHVKRAHAGAEKYRHV
jgi:hypothetical protein